MNTALIPIAILLLILAFPVFLLASVLHGTICFIVEFLDFLKSYFEIFKDVIEEI